MFGAGGHRDDQSTINQSINQSSQSTHLSLALNFPLPLAFHFSRTSSPPPNLAFSLSSSISALRPFINVLFVSASSPAADEGDESRVRWSSDCKGGEGTKRGIGWGIRVLFWVLGRIDVEVSRGRPPRSVKDVKDLIRIMFSSLLLSGRVGRRQSLSRVELVVY